MAILNNLLSLISHVLDSFTNVGVFSILFWAFLLISTLLGIIRMVYGR